MAESQKAVQDDVPRLFRGILPVTDISKAERLCSSLLSTPGKRVSSGRHYFHCGDTVLAGFDPRADTDNFDLGPNLDHVYCAVRDLEEVYSRAQALHAEILAPINRPPYGA